MTDADVPACPRHGEPLEVVEEGVLNGVQVRYWANCPSTTGAPCRAEVRTEDTAHVEPDLFGGAA